MFWSNFRSLCISLWPFGMVKWPELKGCKRDLQCSGDKFRSRIEWFGPGCLTSFTLFSPFWDLLIECLEKVRKILSLTWWVWWWWIPWYKVKKSPTNTKNQVICQFFPPWSSPTLSIWLSHYLPLGHWTNRAFCVDGESFPHKKGGLILLPVSLVKHKSSLRIGFIFLQTT